jgi:branched-chain amino acid transport system substrate-binding protein
MRSAVDIHWHALENVPSAGHERRRLRVSALWHAARGAFGLVFMTNALALGTVGVRAADNEIRIGNTIDYTGPVRAAGVVGKVISAYFDKVNAEGGVNGRRIKFISYDDTYNPAKTVELTHKLVEEDRVLFMFASVGTATNEAVQSYLNANKIPQLFSISGSSMLDQPGKFPWSMAYTPSYETEAHIYAQYLLENQPGGKIAILYQDDAFGKDYVKGLKDGLGGKIPIVAEVPFKVTDPTIEPLIAKLKASGADILFDATTPKFTGMAIKRTAELGWKPLHIVSSASKMISAVVPSAGLHDAEGLLSASFALEGDDPLVANDPVYRDWASFVDRYIPSASKANSLVVTSYVLAKMMVEVLTRCGDDLSRENVMRQASSLKGLPLPMLVPGIFINTSATDHAPIEQMRMIRFSGERWEQFGPVRSGIDPGSVSDSFKTIFRYGPAKKDLANQLNANTVTLMTGSFGSTYSQMGADLASVLDHGSDFRVLPVLGRGSVQAVADILLLKGVDAGIVRKDTLAYLERKDFANNIRNQFVYVTKMFNEEMHVLAPQTIHGIRDLDGKTVAIDLPDASTFVTAINVFEHLGIKPHLLYIEPRLALEQLRRGDIDAIIAVEGKPLQWLGQVNDPSLHLVPVEYDTSLRDEYLPAQLSSEDYPNLISSSAPVGTIAAEAVLASYNWQPGTDRYRRLALLVDSLFSHIAQLQQPPYHPKWQELAPMAPVAGWTRFSAAQEWVDHNAPVASAATPEALGVHASNLSPDDQALYREFIEWKANHAKQPRR